MMSDWSDLPRDILLDILSRLSTHNDCIVPSLVCSSWRSVALEKPRSLPPRIPLLLLHGKKRRTEEGFCLFSVFNHKLHPLKMPSFQSEYFYGSTQGCVIVKDQDSLEMLLINITTGRWISLPPATTLPKEWSRGYDLRSPPMKMVVSIDLAMVMAIQDGKTQLVFCKPGDKTWTIIENKGKSYGHKDVACCDGLFYSLDNDDRMTVYRDGLRIRQNNFPQVPEEIRGKCNLVESSGEVLLVSFKDEILFRNGDKVDVYKLDRIGMKWVRVECLGDQALFYTPQSSFSLSSKDYPELKGNCIYLNFRNDSCGIYNLGTRSYEQFRPRNNVDYLQVVWPTAIWIPPATQSSQEIFGKLPSEDITRRRESEVRSKDTTGRRVTVEKKKVKVPPKRKYAILVEDSDDDFSVEILESMEETKKVRRSSRVPKANPKYLDDQEMEYPDHDKDSRTKWSGYRRLFLRACRKKN